MIFLKSQHAYFLRWPGSKKKQRCKKKKETFAVVFCTSWPPYFSVELFNFTFTNYLLCCRNAFTSQLLCNAVNSFCHRRLLKTVLHSTSGVKAKNRRQQDILFHPLHANLKQSVSSPDLNRLFWAADGFGFHSPCASVRTISKQKAIEVLQRKTKQTTNTFDLILMRV